MLQQKRKSEGFTIIEVLIVLAIAGLIMLIVFLAVPALQRNSRNTARKNDVSNILGALVEYTNNQNGSLPTTCAAGGAGCNASGTWLKNASVGTIDPNAVAFTNRTTAGVPTSPAALDAVNVGNFAKCNSTGTDAVTTNASKRSVVALYLVETGGGTQLQCVESGS